MSMWSEFAERHPEIAEPVYFLDDFLRTPPTRDTGVLPFPEDGRWGNVRRYAYGAGAWVHEDEVLPVVFVSSKYVGEGLTPLEESPVGELLSVSRLDSRVFAVGIEPPRLFGGPVPGARISVGMRNGMSGTLAVRDGVPGFLTAGHVAPDIGALVRDLSGTAIGIVRDSRSLGNDSLDPAADIAFIECDADTVTRTPRLLRTLAERDAVAYSGLRGPVNTWIQALSPNFLVDRTRAGWAEIAMTGDPVANEGDSGGPVFSEDGTLAGHVVGGTKSSYTLVQEAAFQLDAIRAIAID